MANERVFWINRITGRRQVNDRCAALEDLARLVFYQYSVIPVKFYILDPDGGLNNFKRLDVSNLSLSVSINDSLDSATPKVETTTWTKDTQQNCLTGKLDLNTALMNSYLSADGKIGYFQVQFIDDSGSRVPILREQCELRQSVVKTATSTPDPAKSYPTWDDLSGVFAPMKLPNGGTFRIPSPSGAYEVIIGCNDDATVRMEVVQAS